MRRRACCRLSDMSLSACSDGPPDKERHRAEGAVQAARAAGAEVYAPAEVEDAQAALSKYDASVAQHDYRQALNNALEARDRAYEAAKQAGNQKAELRSRADRLLVDVQALVGVATTRLTAAGRSGGAHSERLRALRDAAQGALQETRTLVAKQEYRQALERLSGAGESLRRELQGPEPAASKKKQ